MDVIWTFECILRISNGRPPRAVIDATAAILSSETLVPASLTACKLQVARKSGRPTDRRPATAARAVLRRLDVPREIGIGDFGRGNMFDEPQFGEMTWRRDQVGSECKQVPYICWYLQWSQKDAVNIYGFHQ
jgi:hypothetical protein